MESSERTRYDITEIPLNANLTEVKFAFDANVLVVGQIPIQVLARINDLGNPQVDLRIFREINMEIKHLYLTTTTTSTTTLILFSARDLSVGTRGFGNRAVLIDSVGTEYDARDIVELNVDSTTTNLGDGATYTGSQFATTGYNKITGSVYCNRDVTLYVDQSQDGTNYDVVDSISYTGGNTDAGFSVEVVAPYARVRVVNSAGAATTTLRMYANVSTGA